MGLNEPAPPVVQSSGKLNQQSGLDGDVIRITHKQEMQSQSQSKASKFPLMHWMPVGARATEQLERRSKSNTALTLSNERAPDRVVQRSDVLVPLRPRVKLVDSVNHGRRMRSGMGQRSGPPLSLCLGLCAFNSERVYRSLRDLFKRLIV